MKEIPQKVSESVRKLNPHLYATAVRDGYEVPLIGVPKSAEPSKGDFRKDVAATEVQIVYGKKRIRQSSKPKMNMLEMEFHAKLKQDYEGFEILCQAVRLELANGQWYKPDFFIPSGHERHADWDKCIAYEVKGPKAFRGGFENLKTAARVHQWCKFYLVWKEKGSGKWQRQEVLP